MVVFSLRFWAIGCAAIVFSFSGQAQPSAEARLAEEYFLTGSYAQALPLFVRLAQTEPQEANWGLRAAECHLKLKQTDEAISWLRQQLRQQLPSETALQYRAYQAHLWGKRPEAAQVWQTLLAQLRTDAEVRGVGSLLSTLQEYEQCLAVYRRGREVLRRPELYTPEAAACHAMLGRYGQATQELIDGYRSGELKPALVSTLIRHASQGQPRPEMETELLRAVQDYPGDLGLREITYEYYLAEENYAEALVQVRALDRLEGRQGDRVYQLARTLQNNGQFELSSKALNYLAADKTGPYYLLAITELAHNTELVALSRRPPDTTLLRRAVVQYDQLLTERGRTPATLDALYNKAYLHFNYLQEPAVAEAALNQLLALAVPELKKAPARLLLGDIYLTQGRYADATLAYRYVEDRLAGSAVSAEAKFRFARLAYFRADFSLATARLKTLKDNTAEDVANDAIRLYLLIEENLGADSTAQALRTFARAQLLFYQNNYPVANDALDSLLAQPDMTEDPLMDDLLWEKAQIATRSGRAEDAAAYLQRIVSQHGKGILADDALFTLAELYETVLRDSGKAQELYLQLLKDYPASLFQVKARERIRLLRGDGPVTG